MGVLKEEARKRWNGWGGVPGKKNRRPARPGGIDQHEVRSQQVKLHGKRRKPKSPTCSRGVFKEKNESSSQWERALWKKQDDKPFQNQ